MSGSVSSGPVSSIRSSERLAVDGWDAANFMQALKSLIENPLKLLSMR
jgi:pyruvate/2-oxoglutarate dehydrogenase complex dihydrolipoamide acyltransferase (E2) component